MTSQPFDPHSAQVYIDAHNLNWIKMVNEALNAEELSERTLSDVLKIQFCNNWL